MEESVKTENGTGGSGDALGTNPSVTIAPETLNPHQKNADTGMGMSMGTAMPIDNALHSETISGQRHADFEENLDKFLKEKGDSIQILNTNLAAGTNGIYYVILYKNTMSRV